MQIAILIPLYRNEITPSEQISLHHLNHFLSVYPLIVIKPRGLEKTLQGCETINFPDHYFSSIDAYSNLLLSPLFYETFSAFEYILIYQLDCLVFSRDLQKWCEWGYDYIGSPLFQKNTTQPKISRVGNGGLSLRRVKSFLDVLHSTRYIQETVQYWEEFFSAEIPDLIEFPLPQRWWKKAQILCQVRRGVEWYAGQYSLNEDLFWSDRAKLFHPAFKIAPIQTALQFSFERHPRYCFGQNNHQLPFGCHAWARWDKEFWKPYLIV